MSGSSNNVWFPKETPEQAFFGVWALLWPIAAVTIAFRKSDGCRQAPFSFSITSNFSVDPELGRSSSAAAFERQELPHSGHCLTPVWGDPIEEASDVVAEGLSARMSYLEPQVRGIWPLVTAA